MISVQGLVKRFGSTCAVQGLSFEVRRGETFGLLGPNGAGKSTTISMLIGLLRPDAGKIVIAGGDPSFADARRRIGVAPQSLSLYDELTAAENLSFFARLYGLATATQRARIAWALEFAGLTDRAKHRVSTFSGGMKRRLNLATALIHEPEVLLLDEPTVGVDPQSRNHLFESIEKLRPEGLTILYTTHYMEEARRLCDRVAIVDQGRLLALDTVAGLIGQFGGASQIAAQVDHWPESLAAIASLDDGMIRSESMNPLEEIASWTKAGATFRSLQVTSPDLESVFLHLTGRSLRD